MTGYHVTNRPYWYDTSETFEEQFSDLDVPPLAHGQQLKGDWNPPGSDLYYWGTDRLTDLTDANYKPNNPYAYGRTFMTGAYETLMGEGSIISDKYTYAYLDEARYTIHARHGTGVGDICYVPVSLWIGRNETLKRNYFLELHINPYNWSSIGETGSYVDLNVKIRIRIFDYETGVDTFTDIQTSSGWRLYDTYQYNYQILPYFGAWYNQDTEAPSLVYKLGIVHKSYSSQWSSLVFETGADITNNGHTFKELTPTIMLSDTAIFTSWESDAYLELNPNTIVPFDEMQLDMGPFGPDSEEEGYPEVPGDGHGDDTSDTIEIPDDPLIGVTNVGFVNVYKTGPASLQDMGVELFPDLQYTNPTPISGSTDVVDSIQNGFNAIITALANIPSIVAQQVASTLVNYIIDCHVLPVTPSGGTTENIKVGYKTLTATGDRLSNDYVTFDCGTIKLGEYYSSFADFMTGAKLFLPFVGFVPARPEWFYSDTLGVKYKFNIIDGSFVAYVTSTGKYVNNNGASGTVIAQYSGNACVHLPITGVTYASMVSGLVGSSAGAVAAAGSGNIAGVASSVESAASAHGDIPQSNSYASSGAFLSVRRPYLMIERPVTNYSTTFKKERGLPSNISKKLQNMSGFTILQDVHLDGITATDAEKKELEGLLSKGVIF